MGNPPTYTPEPLREDAIYDLIGMIRIHRAGLEDRLANQYARFRAELDRAEKLNTRIEKSKPGIQKLIAFARKGHSKCAGKGGEGLMGKCEVCDAIAEVSERILGT